MMNSSRVFHSSRCTEESHPQEPLSIDQRKNPQEIIQTVSGFPFQLELELEAKRRRRNERRRRHQSRESMNVSIPQNTDIAEAKLERTRPSKLDLLVSSRGENVKTRAERQKETRSLIPRQKPLYILHRIHKRGSSGPTLLMKDDDINDTLRKQSPVGTTSPPKIPRNGRRRSLKKSMRSIPRTPIDKSVSRSCSSQTFQGDSSQSSSSHNTESVQNSESLSNSTSPPMQPSRRKSAHNILNESLSSFDHSNSNFFQINLFQSSDTDFLPVGGVHGTSLSMLHNSYSSLQMDDDDDFNPRDTASHLSRRPLDPLRHRKRDDFLAQVRQQQRQLAETLRYIKESPVQAQDSSQGLNPFYRKRWKNRKNFVA